MVLYFVAMSPGSIVHQGPRAAVGPLALGAALVAGCGGSSAHLGKYQLEGRRIDDVDIVGNQTFSDDEIIEGLAHRPREGLISRHYTHYDPLALEVDRKRVVSFYRERGYFAAKVAAVKIERDGDDIDIVIRVVEGEPTRITAVDVRGAPARLRPTLDRLIREAGVVPGARMRHPRYLELKEELRRAMVEAGYAHAEVSGTIEVDRAAGGARVALRLEPGPLVRFGAVTIAGNHLVPESSIRERLAWKRGDVFDPDALARTRARLLSLGVFNSVRLDVARAAAPADRLDVRVRVSEGKRNQLKLGGGTTFDPTRLELHAVARYSREGVLDPLTTLRAELTPGYVVLNTESTDHDLVFEGLLGLERIDFLIPQLRARANITARRDLLEAYTSFGPGARLGLDRPLFSNRVHLSGGWTFRQLQLDVQNALEDQLMLESPYRLGFFDQTLIVDLRDRPIGPSRGAFAQVRLEEGTSFAGSAFDYLRGDAELRGYLPLSGVVLAARGRVGWLDASGDEPITQRFYSGSSGHRGFGFRRLSPFLVDADGNARPVGGGGLVELGFELRIPITTIHDLPLRLVTFSDLGDVRPSFQDIDLGQLHIAAGAGVRLDTPLGPFRLDLARRLNRLDPTQPDGTPNPDPGSAWAFQFSLGEAF